jgi:uncharacterized membrane protein YhaH (DUF805 family)
MDARGERFRFLYRQGEGRIDRRQFWLASWPIAAIALALTLVWFVIRPREARDLSHEGLLDWSIAATYLYLMVYVFALFLCAIAQYFVGAKRFADLGRPQGFAGISLFALFIAGAANWYQPRSEGTMPDWATWLFDIIALGVLAWSVFELGFVEGKKDGAENISNVS